MKSEGLEILLSANFFTKPAGLAPTPPTSRTTTEYPSKGRDFSSEKSRPFLFYYQYTAPLLTLGIPVQEEASGPAETAWLYLPTPKQQIFRTLCRIGITNSDAAYFIEDCTLPPKIFEILERSDDAILDLNRMCQAVNRMGAAALTKLEAVVLLAQPQYASEIRQLAENLDQFDFMPKPDSPEADSALTELGYVAYHGSLTLEELMADTPVEQYQREQRMGGF